MIPRLLRENGDFRRFWTAQGISLVGDQVAVIALPLVAILALDAGAAQMGYLTAAALVPNLLFSLHLGAWVDRRGRRRRAMIVADLGRAALVATIPLAYALDVLTVEHLYAVAFAGGTFSVLFYVSYSTLFVSVVPRERYVEANQLLHGSRALSFAGGPSLGGLLVQVVSAPAALVADAVSYVVSAFFLGRMSPVEPPTEERTSGHLVAGARFIWRTAILRASLLALATVNFFNFAFFALFVLYATRELGVSPGTLGLVLGAGAVGGVLGSVAVGRIVGRIGIGPALVLGCVAFTAPLVLVPLAAGPHPLVLGMLLAAELGSGFGVMVLDVTAGSLQQAIVPDRLRARFSGAHMVVNYGVRPLGALVGGWLGSTIGVQETLWIATLGAVAGALFLLPSPLPRLRDLPREPAFEA